MGMLMLMIGGALLYSLVVFFICEEKSLKDANLSDMKCLVTQEIDVSECFEKYNTVQYMLIYFVAVFIFSGVMAYYLHIPNQSTLADLLIYAFIPSLLGSLIILLIKWRFQPMIKIISSFMFGAGYMGATGLALALVYVMQ